MTYSDHKRTDSTSQITVTHKDKNSLEFRITNISRHFANAFRRVMIAEVPTLAIDCVEFIQNTTTLPDEYIAHRIGLIPLYSENAELFEYFDKCTCATGGCPKCQVQFEINVRTQSDENYLVTSQDVVISKSFLYNDERSKDPHFKRIYEEVKPVSLFTIRDNNEPEPIPIAKLGPNQELSLIAFARKGIGRVHSKWSPVCVSAFHQIAEINFNTAMIKNMSEKERTTIVESCPKHVFRQNPHDDTILIENIEECTFCNQCIREAEIFGKKDSIVITSRKGLYVFNVETIGSLSPESVVSKALESLKNKLQTFERNVKLCRAAE